MEDLALMPFWAWTLVYLAVFCFLPMFTFTVFMRWVK